MMKSLLYVSESRLPPAERKTGVDRIVAEAQARNRELEITGALIFTGRHFAQNLEGPQAAVDDLMRRIAEDPRHHRVELVYEAPIPSRRFPIWALAYAGPSTFVAGNVLPLTDPGGAGARRKAAERLIELMRQFVDAHRIADQRNRSE